MFGGQWRVEEGSRDARSFLEGILDRGRRRLNGGEDGVVDGDLREHVLRRYCHHRHRVERVHVSRPAFGSRQQARSMAVHKAILPCNLIG